MSSESPKFTNATGESVPPAEQAIRDEYKERAAITDDLLKQLLDIETKALILEGLSSGTEVVDLLLGREPVRARAKDAGGKSKTLMAGEDQKRIARVNQQKKLEEVAPKVAQAIIEKYGSYSIARAGRAILKVISLGYAGRFKESEWNQRLRAYVEHQLELKIGDYAQLFPEAPLKIDKRTIRMQDTVNEHLAKEVKAKEEKLSEVGMKTKEKLSARDKEALCDSVREEMKGKSLEELKADKNLITSMRASLAEEYFPELKSASKSLTGSTEGLHGELEILENNQEFRDLQATMQRLRATFGDISPSRVLQQLKRRGLIADGYWPSDLVILATFSPNELAEIHAASKGRLAGALVSSEDIAERDDLLAAMLLTARNMTNAVDCVVAIIGNPVDRAKLDQLRIDTSSPENTKEGDALTILAGLAKKDNALEVLLGSSRDYAPKLVNDVGEIRKAGKVLDTMVTKFEKWRPAASRPVSQIERAQPRLPSPEETLEWLRQSPEFQKLEGLIARDDWYKLLKDYKGLDLLKNPKDLEKFLELHGVKDLTLLQGIFMYMPDGARYPMERLLEQSILHSSDMPSGKLVSWLIARRSNPKAPMPREIIEHYGRLRSELLYDDPRFSPDTLLRHTRNSLESAILLTEVMRAEKLPSSPSFEEVMELVARLDKKFPDNQVNLAVWAPFFAGLALQEQLEPRERENIPEPKIRSVRGMLTVPSPPGDLGAFLEDVSSTAVVELEPLQDLLRQHLKSEVDAFAA